MYTKRYNSAITSIVIKIVGIDQHTVGMCDGIRHYVTMVSITDTALEVSAEETKTRSTNIINSLIDRVRNLRERVY